MSQADDFVSQLIAARNRQWFARRNVETAEGELGEMRGRLEEANAEVSKCWAKIESATDPRGL